MCLRSTSALIMTALACTLAAMGLGPVAAEGPSAGLLRGPSADEWLEAAVSGSPLEVADVRMTVRPNNDLFAAGFAATDASGQPLDMSGVHPLAGEVLGPPGGAVRVTVVGDEAVGTIWAGGRVLALVTTPGGPGVVDADAVRLPSRIFDEEPALPTDPITSAHTTGGCLQAVPSHVAPATGLVTGFSRELVFDVSFSVDAQFTTEYGAGWTGVATAFINTIDGFYDAFHNIRVQATDLHSHDAAVFPGTTTSQLLTNLNDHYNAAHVGLIREDAHLFTGKALSGAVGQANCIGGAGDAGTAYTMGMAAHCDPINFLGLTQFPQCHEKIAIHELGHILSAHHHYANCAETLPTYSPLVTFDACTVMINDIGLASMRMSAVNRLVTRGWADSVPL